MDWPIASTLITALGGLILIFFKIVSAKNSNGNNSNSNESTKVQTDMMQKITTLDVNYNNIDKSLTEFKHDTKTNFASIENKIETKIDSLRDLIINHLSKE